MTYSITRRNVVLRRLRSGCAAAKRLGRFALLRSLLFPAIFAGTSWVAAAPPPRVDARLVCEVTAITPGEAFWVALRLQTSEDAHVYWVNPGDAGMAVSIEWKLPARFEAGDIVWPAPARFSTGGIVSFGFSGDVWLLVPITPPADLTAGAPVRLEAQAHWLACRDVCVPGEARISVDVAVEPGGRRDPEWAPEFDQARRRLPAAMPAEWKARFTDGESLTLTLTSPSSGAWAGAKPFYYPFDEGVIEASAAQESRIIGNSLTLTLKKSKYRSNAVTALDGVLALDSSEAAPGPLRAFLVKPTLQRKE